MTRTNYSNQDKHHSSRASSVAGAPLDVMFESVTFPADRKSLLRFARDNDIDQNVQSQIERLSPDQVFNTIEDMQTTLGAGSVWYENEDDDKEYVNKSDKL